MEGKKMFNYETAENRDSKKEKKVPETLVKILQIIIGLIMAILHM
ncbi:hypothetical protein SAMN05421639_104216 [Chryseobacterium shigense]|uniref:Uncharacterized protein n=1 Tax=Chryseobacterium shigense TaxID=297244 RepID=A0A1N7IM35_9FLAO|nr:hypothetical protein [Chryseobacterium shigense]SIS38124.1 hypothetical protein SAMN05421639_104216 [Chryseobacterium shigense]